MFWQRVFRQTDGNPVPRENGFCMLFQIEVFNPFGSAIHQQTALFGASYSIHLNVWGLNIYILLVLGVLQIYFTDMFHTFKRVE